jgi:hypothetical protein
MSAFTIYITSRTGLCLLSHVTFTCHIINICCPFTYCPLRLSCISHCVLHILHVISRIHPYVLTICIQLQNRFPSCPAIVSVLLQYVFCISHVISILLQYLRLSCNSKIAGEMIFRFTPYYQVLYSLTHLCNKYYRW